MKNCFNKKLRSAFVLSFLFAFLKFSFSQSVAQQRCNSIGKGRNISNWLEQYWSGAWPTPNGYTRNDFVETKNAGFTSVRLPITFANITDTLPPYYVDTNHVVFTRIDSVVKWCSELGLILLIDNHHQWDLKNATWRTQLPRFSHLWAVLAKRYKNLNPDSVFLELLNEPPLSIDKDSLVIMYNDAIDSIRAHTTSHSIVVSTYMGGLGLTLQNFPPLADTNLIYTFHSYEPWNFTHQGLVWNTPFYPSGQIFPDAINNYIQESILYQSWDAVIAWKAQYQKPIFLGEFGISKFADSVSRCNYFQFVGTKCYLNNVPWMYWDVQWDFSVFHSGIMSEDSTDACFKFYFGMFGDNSFNGIETPAENILQGVSLFPNLISKGEECNIVLTHEGKYEVKILDASGRILSNRTFSQSENKLIFDFELGVYYVVISYGKQHAVKKLFITD